ncbi:MAG: helix-turn-helix transcriptional regulator [Clostridia bacterium]|nr:helix-turn-helix transcriptional regulator [Clostridia bacterium]
MYDSQIIAARIKERAKLRNKTLGEVLAQSNMSINTVSNINKGGDINSKHLAQIADTLDCSVDYLLGRTDNPEINR